VPVGAELRDALLGALVDVDEAEARAAALGPFEVVEERPGVAAAMASCRNGSEWETVVIERILRSSRERRTAGRRSFSGLFRTLLQGVT
jgi:hypothetical protein